MAQRISSNMQACRDYPYLAAKLSGEINTFAEPDYDVAGDEENKQIDVVPKRCSVLHIETIVHFAERYGMSVICHDFAGELKIIIF